MHNIVIESDGEDQVETYDVSDEALEAYATATREARWSAYQTQVAPSCACC